MNELSNKVKGLVVVALGVVSLVAFGALTQQAEQRTVQALDAAVAAPGKLYTQPTPTVQLGTVVITTKRAS